MLHISPIIWTSNLSIPYHWPRPHNIFKPPKILATTCNCKRNVCKGWHFHKNLIYFASKTLSSSPSPSFWNILSSTTRHTRTVCIVARVHKTSKDISGTIAFSNFNSVCPNLTLTQVQGFTTYKNCTCRLACSEKSSIHSALRICCFCSPPFMVESTSFGVTVNCGEAR